MLASQHCGPKTLTLIGTLDYISPVEYERSLAVA